MEAFSPELIEDLQAAVSAWLAEDVGMGDVTTLATIEPSQTGSGILLAKANGVIAGLALFPIFFPETEGKVLYTLDAADGDTVIPGQTLAHLNGSLTALLTRERVMLNLISHLSGIATKTALHRAALRNPSIQLLDTRKTTPGMRMIEKYAVRCGGGNNHRLTLSDCALIKDNHIAAVGSITKAVTELRRRYSDLLIIVEVTSEAEAREAWEMGVRRLLLDNFDDTDLALVVKAIRVWDAAAGRHTFLEVSGRISLDRLDFISNIEVDAVSVGSLTHSAPALDISLEIDVSPPSAV